MSENPAYLTPNNNIEYGDVVKVDDTCYIKTGHSIGTQTHGLSSFVVTNRLSESGGPCDCDSPGTQVAIDTTHVDQQHKIYINPSDGVNTGDQIMVDGVCYTKTGNTGMMTHALTGDTADLLITSSPPPPGNPGG